MQLEIRPDLNIKKQEPKEKQTKKELEKILYNNHKDNCMCNECKEL
jgi:hypothetical protein